MKALPIFLREGLNTIDIQSRALPAEEQKFQIKTHRVNKIMELKHVSDYAMDLICVLQWHCQRNNFDSVLSEGLNRDNGVVMVRRHRMNII